MRGSTLLLIDAAVNLVVGAVLLIFPSGLVEALGIPEPDSRFYPALLGAILLGIGIALLIEVFAAKERTWGLGLDGAIAINLIGGFVLAILLLAEEPPLPLRGRLVLWVAVAVLVVLSLLELVARKRESS
jgi:hypothetical protein